MNRKLINKDESKISILQLIGFIQLQLGIISLIIFAFFSEEQMTPSVIAISFFTVMIGYSFAFPSLLEGNEGLSTMRIVVFMVTNVICMLLLKIGWSVSCLSDIGLNQYWMGVIAFIFGAKATQSFFESKMAVLGGDKSILKNNNSSSNDNQEDLVNRALKLHEKELKQKYGDIIETLEPGITAANQLGLIANLSTEIPPDFPKIVFVKTNDGKSVAIPIEAFAPEVGKINSGLSYRVSNSDDVDIQGAFGGVVVSNGTETKLLLTCSHVALAGSSKDLGGYSSNGDFGISMEIYDGNTNKGSGTLFYAKRDDKNDTALITLPENAVDWNNELPDEQSFNSVINVDNLTLGDDVFFYSSLRSETTKGVLHKRKSLNTYSLAYGDGIVKNYTEIIVVGNNYGGYWSTMSEKGDSGSILYDKNYNPFGLIIGGTPQFTFALPLTRILEETKTKIYKP